MKKIFTLIEIIVVISILLILSLIITLSFKKRLIKSRDVKRIKDLQTMYSSLELYYQEKNQYPIPDNYIKLYYSGEFMGYQGEFGEGVIRVLGNIHDSLRDPKSNNYYTYLLSEDKEKFQLGVFLENNISTFLYKSLYSKSEYYLNTYIKTKGDNLGIILLSKNKIPLEKLYFNLSGDLSSGGNFGNILLDVIISNNFKYENITGRVIGPLIASNLIKFYRQPNSCLDGYIKVPGNPDFKQKGFCVAKYEMSYNTPNNLLSGWEADEYLTGKMDIVSKKGGYPIVNLTIKDAIKLCKLIGGHLITNHEWMTIARNLELNPVNWSSGIIGKGYIWNGRSWNSDLGCIDTDSSNQVGASIGEPTGSECNEKRTDGRSRNILTLTNGEEVRDFAGNVREFVNKTNNINNLDGSDGTTTSFGDASNQWVNWNDNRILDIYRIMNSSLLTYDSLKGIGSIWHPSGITNNIFIRGGSARDNTGAGIFSIELDLSITNTNKNIGFRCVMY